MVRISNIRIQKLINAIHGAHDNQEKGLLLVELILYLFEKIPGISLGARSQTNVFNSQEIDIGFWNEQVEEGLKSLPNIILVESKNWDSPVSSSEVSWFNTKLRLRGLSFGILVATNGITGDPNHLTSARQIVAQALSESRQLIVITIEDISNIRTVAQLINLIKKKICELVVMQTN